MKKLFAVFAVVAFALTLSACKGDDDKDTTTTYEIALVTDVGTIDDKSFNQGAWEGVKQYAEEKEISFKYYKPLEKSTTAYVDAIDLAVIGGAKVIVTPGYLFEPAVYVAQDKYPNVTFILLDGTPNNKNWETGTGEFRIEDNVYSIFYAEQESGFLAGYAAVKDGFRDLGFMGGMAVPAVIRFGYGFLQGAETAAAELGLSAGDVNVKYKYLGDFGPKPEFKIEASSWYTTGTEVIFAAAGGAGNSVMRAAEDLTDKYVIGVDVDQNSESEKVITSAKKELANSVYQCLTAYYNDDDTFFKTGQSTTMDATNDGIGLPDDFSRFPGEEFTKTDYDALWTKFVADTDNIRTSIIGDVKEDNTAVTISDLGLTLVTVEEISAD